ncbi:hypothetical protein H310_08633 [Aphanomyces invadans]|uniref:FAD-binding FR-type domain-containing protein n=1 Tax=Aphanomyces invadans TaxID=157072 RepID=A0A024TWH1_9STRA|nr:hypothetical protein H310_08633 [Aphanomyces invadans]ETV98495.1 hypothetical protein H310_08633 [Aphanomyces invadans]|eukprot:XP_008872692.1 hypothetical protein H310_08633 [Aphanomyces invadans]
MRHPTCHPLLAETSLHTAASTEGASQTCAVEAADVDGDLALRVFNSLDTMQAGVLTTAQVVAGVRAAAATCRITLHGNVELAVHQFFHGHSSIDAKTFVDTISSVAYFHPSVYDRPARPSEGDSSGNAGGKRCRFRALWTVLATYPLRIKLWWVLYAALNVGVFFWKFKVYHDRKPAFNLAGYNVCIARAAAQVNLVSGFFLLWPTFTRAQYAITKASPDIARAMGFEHRVACHVVHGVLFYVSGWVHVVAQVISIWVKIPRASDSAWAESALAKAPDFAGKPKPPPWAFVATLTGWTGVAMLVCSLGACACKMKFCRWSTRRNIRWNVWGHVLDGVMFVLTFVHGIRGWLEPPQAAIFLAIPVVVYVVVEVFPRYLCTKLSAVSHYSKTHDTLTLYIPKTKRFHDAVPGSFLRLHVPLVDKVEWHPFSITAQDPHELAVQIQVAGDWTRRLYEVVHPHLFVRMDGPIPAPAVEVGQYGVAVLFGAGIGITPYVSVLQQRLANDKTLDQRSHRSRSPIPVPTQQLYVHWQTSKQTMFATHQHVLGQVGSLPCVDVQLYLTGTFAKAVPDATDVLRVLQWMATDDCTRVDAISGIANLPLPTKLGRPNYHGVLAAVATAHHNTPIGIFFCGPAPLKATIRNTLHQVTTEFRARGNDVKFIFHPEVF